jgi:hypothetical protein
MMNPLQIHFHEMPSSEAVEAKIRAHVEKLETFYDRITSCRVTVEESHRRHTTGNHFNCRIDIIVPGSEIFVGRDPDQRSKKRSGNSRNTRVASAPRSRRTSTPPTRVAKS